MQVKLFTGQGCGLCDDAMALIQRIPSDIQPEVKKVDIRSCTTLYHQYAVRIPVLKREDNGEELGWPFDSHTLIQFLS